MRKLLLGIILVCSIVLPVSAVDFGGLVENTTKGSIPNPIGDKLYLSQRNSLTGWLRAPLNEDGSLYFATEGFFVYNYSNGNINDSSAEPSNGYVIDLTLLKLGYSIRIDNTTSLGVSLGRFALSDMSGLVFNQNSDGIKIDYTRRRFVFDVYTGYTGFLNGLNVSMLRHPASQYAKEADIWYDFASPYVILQSGLTFPYLFLNQTLGLEFIAAAGVTGLNYGGNNPGNAGISRFYLTGTLNGPIAPNLFYIFTTTFELEEYGQANLTRGIVTYYPNFYSSSVSLNAVYASGEQGFLTGFKGITNSTAVYSRVEQDFSSIFRYGVSGTIKPVNTVHLGAGLDVVLACPEDHTYYDGIQWNASVTWQPFSDLTLSLQGNQFIAKPEDEGLRDKVDMTIKVGLAF